MKKLYCFDFDGTLTKRDTLPLFLKFCRPVYFYVQFLKHLPVFVFWKLRLITSENIKQSFVSSLLKGQTKEHLNFMATRFFEKYHTSIFHDTALEFFKQLDGTADVYIVTASLDIWTKPFAEFFNAGLISTKAQFSDGVFTGGFVGKNCNGKEKVNRIREAIDLSKYDKTFAFGDTKGDRAMLEWADESYFKFFA